MSFFFIFESLCFSFDLLVYKKHYPPALKDEVWRLEKIGKDGAFHKKLNAKGINTVEDFLRLLIRDQQGLRNVSFYIKFPNFFCGYRNY